MNNSPAIHNNTELDAPGIGVAGVVMCPYFRGACLKNGCEMWVELMYGQQKVGRCTFAWQSVLLTEIRQAIDRLHNETQN